MCLFLKISFPTKKGGGLSLGMGVFSPRMLAFFSPQDNDWRRFLTLEQPNDNLKPSTFSPGIDLSFASFFSDEGNDLPLEDKVCSWVDWGATPRQLNGSPPEKVTESQKGKVFFLKHNFSGAILLSFSSVYNPLLRPYFLGGNVTLQGYL